MSSNTTEKIYVLDTDWMVVAMTQYPPDIVPEFWDHLSRLIHNGQIFICDPVYQEVLHQDDDLSAWLKINANGAHIDPSDEDLTFVKDHIMSQYQEKFSNWFSIDDPNGLAADPFLVALAANKKAVVVTYESKIIMQKNTPISKVPNACDEFGIECICNDRKNHKQSPVVDFLRDSGFRQ